MIMKITDRVMTPDGIGTITMFERFQGDTGDADHAKVVLDGKGGGVFYPLSDLKPV